MNKFLPFLAFAALALFACSDDKATAAPNHEELCKDNVVSKECLVGNWKWDGAYNGSIKECGPTSGKENFLILEANDRFTFKGGDSPWFDEIGGWSLLENDVIERDANQEPSPTSGTVKILEDGKKMEITSKSKRAVFSLCGEGGSFVDKFTWDGN